MNVNCKAECSQLLRWLFVLLLALPAPFLAAADSLLVEDKALHSAAIRSSQYRMHEIESFAERADSHSLLWILHNVENDRDIDSGVRDYWTETLMFSLSRTIPTQDSRDAVARYENSQVSTFVRLQDEHGSIVVPLYDVAAAAKFTVRSWTLAIAEGQISKTIESGYWLPTDIVRPPIEFDESVWRQATVSAFRAGTDEFIRSQRAQLVDALAREQAVDVLLLQAAMRMHDAALFRLLAEKASKKVARESVTTSKILPAHDQFDVLVAATEHPDVASSAILSIGALSNELTAARAWLIRRLDNTNDGASAALALARHANDDVLQAMGKIILGDAGELKKLRAALVLRLSDSSGAVTLRQELLTQPLLSSKLSAALR